MPEITESFVQNLFWIYLVVFLTAALFSFLYRSRLKRFHPDKWRELGSPGTLNHSISNSVKMLRFTVIRKGYRDLNDPRLKLYGDGFRIGFIAIICFIVGIFALMLVAQEQHGIWSQSTRHTQPLRANHPLNATGATLLISLAFGFLANAMLKRRVKTHHPGTWVELGQPSFLNSNRETRRAWWGFVSKRAYRALNDPLLRVYAGCNQLAILVFAVTFLGVAFGYLKT